MARITKKELEEKLEQANKLVESQQQQIEELQKENEKILNDKEVVSKVEFMGVIKELERIQVNYETLKKQYERENEKLNNKLAAYKKSHQDFIKKIELNKESEKVLNEHISTLEEKCEYTKKDTEILRNHVEFLRAENLKLTNKKSKKVHNERGAGRKSNLTTEQVQRIEKLHQKGKSYGAIAKEVGLSKSYIYKLINKPI